MTPVARKKPSKKTPPTVGPSIPRGFHSVTPSLAVVGGLAALDFYRKAFGAKILRKEVSPQGKLVHGQIQIGDSMLLVADVFRGSDRAAPSMVETTTVTLHLYSKDVESLWNRATAAGAKVTMPLSDQYWGERYGHLVDPFGHHWSLSQPIRMAEAAKAAKRKEAMKAFAKGDDPAKVPIYTDI